MDTLNTASLLIGNVSYSWLWSPKSHWWALDEHSPAWAVTAGLRKATVLFLQVHIQLCSGVSHRPATSCSLPCDAHRCTTTRVTFLTKGLMRVWLNDFKHVSTQSSVSLKTEPMESIYYYYLVVTFCNLYSHTFCSPALGKQLYHSGVILPPSPPPPRACIHLTLLAKVTNRVFTFTRPLIDNT